MSELVSRVWGVHALCGLRCAYFFFNGSGVTGKPENSNPKPQSPNRYSFQVLGRGEATGPTQPFVGLLLKASLEATTLFAISALPFHLRRAGLGFRVPTPTFSWIACPLPPPPKP